MAVANYSKAGLKTAQHQTQAFKKVDVWGVQQITPGKKIQVISHQCSFTMGKLKLQDTEGQRSLSTMNFHQVCALEILEFNSEYRLKTWKTVNKIIIFSHIYEICKQRVWGFHFSKLQTRRSFKAVMLDILQKKKV